MSILDDLLDGTVDDLADMPQFKPFPVGSYQLKLGFEEKEIGESKIPSVEMKMTLIAVGELEDPNAEAPKPGDSQNVLFMLQTKEGKTNEIGQGQMKEVLQVLAPAFPEVKKMRELLKVANGVEVLAVLGQRQDKNDKDKKYNTLKQIALV